MPWYDTGYGSQSNYHFSSAHQQYGGEITIPIAGAITKVKAYFAPEDSAGNARLGVWNATTLALLAQSAQFSAPNGSRSIGGQTWHERDLVTPILVSAGQKVIAGYWGQTSRTWLTGLTQSNTPPLLRKAMSAIGSMSGAADFTSQFGNVMMVEVFIIFPPESPSNLSVARISDGQQNLSWTRVFGDDQNAPYSSQRIQRWDNVTNAWYDLTVVSGSAVSYSDTTTQANREYRYRIRSENAAGNSGWIQSAVIATTPAALKNLSAVRNGEEVDVFWTNDAWQIADRITVERRVDGGAWQSLTTNHSGSAVSYRDTSPPIGTLRYRARTHRDALASAWAESNDMTTVIPPAAPSNLTRAPFDATEAADWTWQHNSLDGTVQTAYEFAWRPLGETGWVSTGKVTDPTAKHTTAPVYFGNGSQVEWRVRTWGQHADPGPWSQASAVWISSKPGVAVTYPATDEDVHDNPSLTVTWLYSQSQEYPQDAFRVTLLDSDGGTLHFHQGQGSVENYKLPYMLLDQEEYHLQVQVRSNRGLWSNIYTRTFLVEYAAPPIPVISAEVSGYAVAISIDNTQGEPEAVKNQVWRQIGEDPWRMIADQVPVNGAITDYTPALGQETRYYALAVSEIGSISQSNLVEVFLEAPGAFIINSGPGFFEQVVIFYNGRHAVKKGSANVVLHQFHGRAYPTEFKGSAQIEEVQLTGLIPRADRERVEKAISERPLWYRDHYGRHWPGSVTFIDWTQAKADFIQLAITVTRVED